MVALLATAASFDPVREREAVAQAGSEPQVSLAVPFIRGLRVVIDGVAGADDGESAVERISWSWGDGSETDHPFPAMHDYAAPGTYTVEVTAHFDDGQAATTTTEIQTDNLTNGFVLGHLAKDFVGDASAREVTFRNATVEPVGTNRVAVEVDFQMNGVNRNPWKTQVYFVQWCRDANGTPFGASSGEGGTATENEAVLIGEAGRIRLEFGVTLLSDMPALAFPASCTDIVFMSTIQFSFDYSGTKFSPPVPAPTTWMEGTPVRHCGPPLAPCTGW